MNGVGPSNCLRVGLAQPEIAHLARVHELGHRSHGLLNRNVWIEAMLIVKINTFNSQSFKRTVASLAHVFRPAVDCSNHWVIRITPDGELCRDNDFVATRP